MSNQRTVSLPVPAPPIPTAQLAAIVGDASLLWERFDAARFSIEPIQSDEVIQRRLERWCEVVAQGNWEVLHKRLQWDGIDLEEARSRLGSVRAATGSRLPDWAETLHRVVASATTCGAQKHASLPTDAQDPIPFEDALLPALRVAREKLLSRLGSARLAGDCLPLSVLAAPAYRSLERTLLKRLAGLCGRTLDLEFSSTRAYGKNVLYLLGVEAEDSARSVRYTAFVQQLLRDGMLAFFGKYPVLARLIALAVDFWVESTAEFVQRLEQDRVEILRTFGSAADGVADRVSEIQGSLSDLHARGRSVLLLGFESGLKIVYKPKDLGLEVAFNAFIEWCNRASRLLDLKVIKVLGRDGYGWVEYIDHRPCADIAAAQRFYERAGMLLCVLYVLRGTDCHDENLIAHGEHLVLIDMETLLYPEANPIENLPDAPEFEIATMRQFWDSVLRTGLLPRWNVSGDGSVTYDISGLGSTDALTTRLEVPRWHQINTDGMHVRQEFIKASGRKNAPHTGGAVLSPDDYHREILAGFEKMYGFVLANKALLAAASPLATLQDQQVRFVMRPTRLYSTILQRSWSPERLRNGVEYSIELDQLSRAFLVAQSKPNAWPVVAAEIAALAQMDIPLFSCKADGDELQIGHGEVIPRFFVRAGYPDTLGRLQAMGESDLLWQKALIQGSFHAKMARAASAGPEAWDSEPPTLLTGEQMIAEAAAIATELEAKAIVAPDGSVNWIGLAFVFEAERVQLQVLSDSLYDGQSGIALFLAALHRATGKPHYRQLALRIVQSLHRRTQMRDAESQQRWARFTGIGGASGIGAMVYVMTKVSDLLGENALLDDARGLTEWMTPELIGADKKLDVVVGAAGAILGLLSLYRATGDSAVLAKAVACGEHLLSHRVSYNGAPKAWQAVGDIPLTGFSHGAAGIAYALLRLHAVTGNDACRQAALEGIQYERSAFSEAAGNWPDFRASESLPGSAIPVQWCHGATGIGLARIGSFGLAPAPDIEREIEIAMQTTCNFGLQAVDHLCCGNMGRIEALLVGAHRLGRHDWQQTALSNASKVVARAARDGAYRLFGNLPCSVTTPSFFRGTSGIGYQLLRLADPSLPSVLLWE